jgi:hypothetical protein
MINLRRWRINVKLYLKFNFLKSDLRVIWLFCLTIDTLGIGFILGRDGLVLKLISLHEHVPIIPCANKMVLDQNSNEAMVKQTGFRFSAISLIKLSHFTEAFMKIIG